jgi:uncharacterized LabA/DUF88 family protein
LLPEPAYLFIDAGHLRECFNLAMRQWFDRESEVDCEKLKTRVRAFKLFYYDCLDDIQRSGEAAKAFKDRVEQQQEQFDRIRSILGAHVRLGSLAGSSQKRRRQKGVDIQLAVDMMNHAIRQNMKRAVLLTGDADFKPLVESMIQLVRAADASELLAFDEYFNLAPNELREEFPVPKKRTIVYQKGYYEGPLIATGKIGGSQVLISRTDQYNAYIPTAEKQAYVLSHSDWQRLKLYIQIQFPDVTF